MASDFGHVVGKDTRGGVTIQLCTSQRLGTPDCPLRPGDMINGTVTVTSTNESGVKCRGIRLKLTGIEETSWREHTGEKRRRFGAKIELFPPITVVLEGRGKGQAGADVVIGPRLEAFPFSIPFPSISDLPPSIDFGEGKVVYTLEAYCDLAWKLDPTAAFVLCVTDTQPPEIDVTAAEGVHSDTLDALLCCGRAGRVDIGYHIPSLVVQRSPDGTASLALQAGASATTTKKLGALRVTIRRSMEIRSDGSITKKWANDVYSADVAPCCVIQPPDSHPPPTLVPSVASFKAAYPSFSSNLIDVKYSAILSLRNPWAGDPDVEFQLWIAPYGSVSAPASAPLPHLPMTSPMAMSTPVSTATAMPMPMPMPMQMGSAPAPMYLPLQQKQAPALPPAQPKREEGALAWTVNPSTGFNAPQGAGKGL